MNSLIYVDAMIGPSIPKEVLEKRRQQDNNKICIEGDDSDDSDDEILGPQLPERTCNNKINLEQTVDLKEKLQAHRNKAKAEEVLTLDTKQEQKPQIPSQEKQTLLSKHRAKCNEKNKITKFDSKENLNSEIRKEILRKLEQNGGLEGKFTRGS